MDIFLYQSLSKTNENTQYKAEVHLRTFAILIFVKLVNIKYNTETISTSIVALVNNQHEAQFFMYVYLYSLHISGSHVPIIRRIIVTMRHLVYATLCRCASGM